jgi:hypothetical protein
MGKINITGRSKHEGGYVKLPHYISDCFAWSQLSANARCSWLEFVRLYGGSNNGRLAMPVRKLADRLHTSKGTAANVIQELLTYGFIDLVKASTFAQKRLAAEYRLTHLPCNVTGEMPSKNFMRTVTRVGEAAE